MIEEKLYNISKASDILGITPQTLRKWSNNGLVRAVRMPNNYRMIPESEVVRLLNGDKEISKPILNTKEKVEQAAKEILTTTEIKEPKVLTRLVVGMYPDLIETEVRSNLELLTLRNNIVKDEKGILKYVGMKNEKLRKSI